MKKGGFILFVMAGILVLAGVGWTGMTDAGKAPLPESGAGKRYTVAERLEQYGAAVEQQLRPVVEAAGLSYPPYEFAYVAFKDTSLLEVYGRMGAEQPWHFIRTYPVQRASGRLGPKLAEGDYQVPEGIYRAEFLNANSRFHLSIRLDYPNAFDREMAKAEGRTRLGGDIMIHGGAVSVGCLAMGDEAAEALFILAALVSKERVQIVVSPTDFRQSAPWTVPAGLRPWANTLYLSLEEALKAFPLPAS